MGVKNLIFPQKLNPKNSKKHMGGGGGTPPKKSIPGGVPLSKPFFFQSPQHNPMGVFFLVFAPLKT